MSPAQTMGQLPRFELQPGHLRTNWVTHASGPQLPHLHREARQQLPHRPAAQNEPHWKEVPLGCVCSVRLGPLQSSSQVGKCYRTRLRLEPGSHTPCTAGPTYTHPFQNGSHQPTPTFSVPFRNVGHTSSRKSEEVRATCGQGTASVPPGAKSGCLKGGLVSPEASWCKQTQKNRPQNRKGIACPCVTTPSSLFCFLPNYLISECPLQNETEIKAPKPTHQAGGSSATQMSTFSRKTGGACLESRALGRSRHGAPGSCRK